MEWEDALKEIVGTEKEVRLAGRKANYPFGKLCGRVVICLYGHLVLFRRNADGRGRTGTQKIPKLLAESAGNVATSFWKTVFCLTSDSS